MLLPGIWTSLTSRHSISRHIERMFRIRFVLLRRPELSAFLTGLPRTRVTIDVVGIAQRKAFVRILAAPPTSKGQKSGIAAYPLLATRRLHQRCRDIATKAAMLPGNGGGFHPIVCHHRSLAHAVSMTTVDRAHFTGPSCVGSLYPLGSASSYRPLMHRLR